MRIEETCFYLVRSGAYYLISTEPSLNLVIKNGLDLVRDTAVTEELEDRIQRLFGGRQFFEPKFFVNEPAKVDDQLGKPKLVIMHFNDTVARAGQTAPPEGVRDIFLQTGALREPRKLLNDLVFLVADAGEVERMRLKAREYLALRLLVQEADRGAGGSLNLSEGQRDTLKKRKEETELFLKVAIALAYRHLFVPTAPRDTPGRVSQPSLRHIMLRSTDAAISARLETRRVRRSEPPQILTR